MTYEHVTATQATITRPVPDFIIGKVSSDMQIWNVVRSREQFNATGYGAVDNIHVSRRRLSSTQSCYGWLWVGTKQREQGKGGEGRRLAAAMMAGQTERQLGRPS